ncbi:hypothetical protein JD844_004562 [Phrynosoma platyrhinos]|uniref:DUF4455 domain-containing protein n=1 Tax=Phrynosoma platyrhinos TaxID=52577 RepID=A0ABQ7SDI2_PHRPL|nr:hypothetical protein JD844_004562 [Phrynosoma platyrhinos]
MASPGVTRLVPSGKVYRQIFDDEINLVRTLGEVRSRLAQHKIPQIPGRIPLVRETETCSGNGFLSHRQQTWVEGMPNDDYIENPVHYKETTTLESLKNQESDSVIAAREVRGLAEVTIPEKKNSNIIERLSESRKCRYNEAVAKLKQELAHIGKEMELHFLEPGKLFLAKLSESDQTIESLFQRAANDTNLETYTMQDFEQIWDLVFQETLKKRQWIRELDEALRQAEVDRAERIKVLLTRYTKILEDIAYLLTSDVHRFIHKEAMMINQALLANRRAIAKLFVNLMEADLKRDVAHRWRLEERIKIWKVVQKENIIASFRTFMESERIQNPSTVKMELENMLRDQLLLAEKRRTLLFSLCNLLPLLHSKAEVNEWYESVIALNKRIDTHNVQCMMRIRIQYEKVCQECLSKVQESKQKLLKMKICTEEEAEKIVNPNFFQLVGNLQSRFEREMEKMDDDLEHLAKHTEVNCRLLYQYFQDALVLLDAHQQRLSHQEDELHNKLNECRNKHENLNKIEPVKALATLAIHPNLLYIMLILSFLSPFLATIGNQLREVHLDISVDKLRVQSSDEKLKSQLEKVYAALDFIRTGYITFHQDLLSKVTAHPDHILHELISYSSSISRYFHVKEIYKGREERNMLTNNENKNRKIPMELDKEEQTMRNHTKKAKHIDETDFNFKREMRKYNNKAKYREVTELNSEDEMIVEEYEQEEED